MCHCVDEFELIFLYNNWQAQSSNLQRPHNIWSEDSTLFQGRELNALLYLKRETNNDFILPSVYKALRVNPWRHTPSGEQYLCLTSGNVLIDCCCRALLRTPNGPAGSWEQGQLPVFETNRTHVSHTATYWKQCVFSPCAVSCHALLLVLTYLPSLVEQQLTNPLYSEGNFRLIFRS